MALIDIITPRVNANEDEVLVAELHVAVGDQVDVGDLLISAETTKASVDIEATHAGTVSKINGKKGRMIASGSVIVVIDIGGDSAAAGDDTGGADGGSAEVKVTTKARLRAEELGVDLDTVAPKAGRIGVAEVEAAAGARPGRWSAGHRHAGRSGRRRRTRCHDWRDRRGLWLGSDRRRGREASQRQAGHLGGRGDRNG